MVKGVRKERKRNTAQKVGERRGWFKLCDVTLLIPKFLTYPNFDPVQSTSQRRFSTHGHTRRDAKRQSDPANVKAVNTHLVYISCLIGTYSSVIQRCRTKLPSYKLFVSCFLCKGKVIPLQARCGPEGG